MNALFEEFSAANAASWKERLAKDLKGISFEQLSLKDRNGATIHPFYTAEDQSKISTALFSHQDWVICSRIEVSDEKQANAKALAELQSGASGLCFVIKGATDLDTLLADIQLAHIHCQFLVAYNRQAFYKQWSAYQSAHALEKADVWLIADPIAEGLASGDWAIPKADWLSMQGNSLCVDALCYQNAGANSSYQLACSIAQANEYLHWLEEAGKLAPIHKVFMSIAVGTDFFEEIAKTRALRILIQNLLDAYGCKATIHLHLETSNTYRSAYDAYNNLLRDSIAGMAAVLGGCDSLLIHPFDAYKKDPSDLSNRMSRNQQLIFKEEAYFNQIADAASGSFYIEQLTEQLATQAWTLFQDIEKSEGIIATAKQIKENIERQAATWIEEYKSGKRILIGVNKYVNATDAPVAQPHQTREHKGIASINLAQLNV
ncbi:MAG: methylmalonyl-CoA mutase family protein [Phycisphaerales bacterium]|nr:methylmalonyl-CoA mutase family protein [Phycisphaerales bacterium]